MSSGSWNRHRISDRSPCSPPPCPTRSAGRQRHHGPREISIEVKERHQCGIRQRVWIDGGVHKLDALTRILEVGDFDG